MSDPTDGVVAVATGIPPHIELASQVQQVLEVATNILTNLNNQTEQVIAAVQKAVEDQALQSGHVTGSRLLEVLNEFQEKSLSKVDERLAQIRNDILQHVEPLALWPVCVRGWQATHQTIPKAFIRDATNKGAKKCVQAAVEANLCLSI